LPKKWGLKKFRAHKNYMKMLKKFEAKKKLVVKKNFRYKMGKTLGNQFLAKKNWGGGGN